MVRAPSDGYVSTVGLRPGTMSTALGLAPVMTFVPVTENQSREYVAAFRQNSLQRLQAGEKAELLFRRSRAPFSARRSSRFCRQSVKASFRARASC
ncbi:Inner membrane protein yibH [Raoultella terrigena]|uniref:Inner membrane protein yibH n=1 Tax=Raoultella terrigena TaxID=577 RepID=A0A4U9D9H4_RAOTE|nr:Inner membrane protein yibH [Raoultella terrigena]